MNTIKLVLQLLLLMFFICFPIGRYFRYEKIDGLNKIKLLILFIFGIFLFTKFFVGVFKVPSESMEPTIKVGAVISTNNKVYDFFSPKREDIIVFRETIYNRYCLIKRLMGLPGETVFINENNRLFVDSLIKSERDYLNIGDIEKISFYIPKKGDKVEIITNPKEIEKFYEISKSKKLLEDNLLEELPDIKFYVNKKETGKLLDLLYIDEIKKALESKGKIEVELKDDYYFFLGDNSLKSLDSRFFGFIPKNNFIGKKI